MEEAQTCARYVSKLRKTDFYGLFPEILYTLLGCSFRLKLLQPSAFRSMKRGDGTKKPTELDTVFRQIEKPNVLFLGFRLTFFW